MTPSNISENTLDLSVSISNPYPFRYRSLNIDNFLVGSFTGASAAAILKVYPFYHHI
jgi:hypothetical protein